MFGLFASKDAKMRETATNWLEVADKILAYRGDILSTKDSGELRKETEALRQRVTAKVPAEQLKLSIEALEPVLRRTGGAIYPKTAFVENIEFLLVAAIVIMGVKTFFVQPFKIPTNSMWPTFNGMTPQVYVKPADEPGPLLVAGRALALGAWPHRLDAPADGEIEIPIMGSGRRGIVSSRTVPGRTWLVLPTDVREYSVLVSGVPVQVKLPMDFDFDWVVADAFFADQKIHSPADFLRFLQRLPESAYSIRTVNGEPMRCIRTGRYVHKGDRVLSFDERTGDMLFVDRLTYNFTKPKVGQGFVFATKGIERIADQNQYFVKRLIGTPGDVLEIHEPMIFRNGRPITGADAFELNAKREGRYHGYFNGPEYLRDDSDKVTVPAASYFAMGDNSGNSADSRYWGFVPAANVVGRPLFIYYPFSEHWGPSR